MGGDRPDITDALARAKPDDADPLARRLGLQRLLGPILGEDRPPLRIGRWVVERRVGRGGMGAVYRGRDPDTGQPVAIKTVARADDAARFEHEAQILATIDAPGVVRYLDHGRTDDGAPFLVMAWLEGEDLAARIRRGPLPIDEALRVARGAAAALTAAHRAGVVHRDVKPSNLVLTGPGEVVVVDFGIARATGQSTRLTLTGEVLGTPAYMAPEQLRGAQDPRTDVYGLGATLFEALTGVPVFPGAESGAVLLAVLTEPAPPASLHRPEIPLALDALLLRMLAKDPDDRPGDMHAVWTELAAVASEPTVARRPVLSFAERALGVDRADAPGADHRLHHQLDVRGGQDAAAGRASVGATDSFGRASSGAAHPAGHAQSTSAAEPAGRASSGAAEPAGRASSSAAHPAGHAHSSPAHPADLASSLANAPDSATASERPPSGAIAAADPGLSAAGPGSTAAPPAHPAPPWFGRAWELGLIAAALAGAVDAHEPAVIRVEGASGTGRSALLAEVTPPGWQVLAARATRADTGGSFSVLRRWADTTPALREVRDALSALDAALDPGAAVDRVRLAWLDAVAASVARGPTLLVVDDVDLADVGTVRLLAAAVALVPDGAWAVITSALPTCTPGGLAPAAGGRAVDVPLGPLSPRAAAALVRAHAPGCADAALRAALDTGQGHPGHLVALAAAIRRGLGVAPLAELAWRHLRALSAEDRRVLRAASLVGEPIDRGAVACLLDVDPDDPSLRRPLARLIAAGVLHEDGAGLRFALDAVQLAAAQSCEDAERAAAYHALARRRLARGGPPDATLARYLEGAGQRDDAAQMWLRVARAAVGTDVAGPTEDALARAAALATGPAARAEVGLTRATLAFWRGDLDAALASTAEVLTGPRDRSWFRAASLAATIAGQRGAHDAVTAHADALVLAHPPDPPSAEARCVGLCRAATQLVTAGRPVDTIRGAINTFTPSNLQPEARAWWWRATGTFAAPAFDATADAFILAHRAHLEDHDRRSAAQVGLYLGSIFVWSGAWDRAEAVITDARADARRLGSAYLETWADYTRGKLLAETAPLADALTAFDAVIRAAAGSPRIQAGAWLWSAVAAMRAERWEIAAHRAEQAAIAHTAPAVRIPALAAAAYARHRAGSPVGALQLEGELPPEQVEFADLVPLARLALGVADATPVATAAEAGLLARASTFSDPIRRNHYLEGPWGVVTLRRAIEAAKRASPPADHAR